MQSLIAKTKTLLTPSASSANIHDTTKFRTEKQADSLFQKTSPDVDGEDCLHDCASCTEQLPRKWSIDEDDKLYGHVNGWETHLIVGTGKTDWVRDITDEKGSLMQAVGKLGVELTNGKLMLSASDMSTSSDCETVHDKEGSDYTNDGRTRCIILPNWEMVENVGIGDAKWLLDDVISKGSTNSTPVPKVRSAANTAPSARNGDTITQTQPLPGDRDDTPDPDHLTISTNTTTTISSLPLRTPTPPSITRRQLPHRAIILMCSHGTRDWRCGKSAPILKRELERHLRPLGLYRDASDDRPGGVGIYFINHVGGHKYSANVMIYRRQGQNGTGDAPLSDEAVQGIWLARVRPEDCENIVKYTVLQGKLVKPLRQLRGGFDRERGVVSW